MPVTPGKEPSESSCLPATIKKRIYWRQIGSQTKLCRKPNQTKQTTHRISSDFEIFCLGPEMGEPKGLWALLQIFHLGRGSDLFCLLVCMFSWAPHPAPPLAFFSFLLKVAFLWSLYPVHPCIPTLSPAQAGEVSSWISVHFPRSIWHCLVPLFFISPGPASSLATDCWEVTCSLEVQSAT